MIMRKIFYTFSLFIFSFAFTGAFAYAFTGMTAEELRAEIARLTRVAESIRAQLLKYGDDPSTVVPGESDTPITMPGAYIGKACLQTNLQMERGQRGGSVKTLQQFLAQQGVYPPNLITGYFGRITEQAVQRWQAKNGIIDYGTPQTTGYGRVGPSTLRAMQAGCPGGVYTGPSGSLIGGRLSGTSKNTSGQSRVQVERYTLSLNPTRGIAPLTVTADLNITGSTCTSYLLDWGDGSLPVSYNSNKSDDCVPLPISIKRTHIYNTAGEYKVIFKTGKAPLTRINAVSDIDVEVIGVPVSSY